MLIFKWGRIMTLFYTATLCTCETHFHNKLKQIFVDKGKASLSRFQFQPEDREVFHLTWGLVTASSGQHGRGLLSLPHPTSSAREGGHTGNWYSCRVVWGMYRRASGVGRGKVRDRRAGEEREKGCSLCICRVAFRLYDTSVFCCWTLEQVQTVAYFN